MEIRRKISQIFVFTLQRLFMILRLILYSFLNESISCKGLFINKTKDWALVQNAALVGVEVGLG